MVAAGPLFAMPPGTGYEYSNLGYGVIGRVIERVTGERPQDVIDRLLIRPLALDRTTWTQPEHDDWARPYRVEDGHPVADGPPLGDGALAPMGGLWSTVEDVVRVMAFFDDAFPARDGDDDGPLRRASRREQQQVHRAVAVARTEATGEGLDHVPERIDGGGYGFGLQVIHDQRFGHIVGHSGGLPGYGSNMRWLPGRRVGAVALANSTYAPMRLLTRRMLEVLDDHQLVPPVVVPVSPMLERAADELLALINDWSDEAADALFADNVALDESYERRARQASEIVSTHGRLTRQKIEATFATDGTVTATAADGREVKVWLALAPLATTPRAGVRDHGHAVNAPVSGRSKPAMMGSMDAATIDRAVGAVMASAVGDALGAPYEFGPPNPSAPCAMEGGGGFRWEPGEWTDDTQMALSVLTVLATGSTDVAAIGEEMVRWYRSRPRDVGIQTAGVLV